MSFKKLSAVFVLALFANLAMAGGAPEPQVPCTRPLKHLNCQDLKDLQEKKNCEVEVPVCDPVETIVEKEVIKEVPVLVPVEVKVEVEKQVFVPVPVCAACDFIQQWNIQAIGGEKNFRGLQGRYKNFGFRAGEYDLGREPSLGYSQSQQAALNSSSRTGHDSNNNHDSNDHDSDVHNKVTICHIPPGNPANQHTISVDDSAVAAHLAHGDYLGECRPLDICSDGVCRTECPQNCDNPPNCDDGICRTECPLNCDDPPNCSDGICRTECPANCDDPPSCTDGVCREECPENCVDPEPRTTSSRKIESGRAFTIEGLYFIPLPNKCSAFSLYVGAGVTRRTEIGLLEEIETGRILEQYENNKYRPTGTIGAEYRFPFSLVLGATYDTSFGFGATAGYSYRFK